MTLTIEPSINLFCEIKNFSFSKIEGISFFTDDSFNFMCSYCELNFSDGKFHSELNYVLIRPTGEVIDGIEYYGSDILADKQCSKMFKITLN